MNNSFKYLLIGLLSSMGLLFVIWFGLLVAQHPNDFYEYHLDLKATFERFVRYFDDLQISVFGKSLNFSSGQNNLLSGGLSWTSSMVNTALNAVEKGEDFFNQYLNANPAFNAVMMVTGLSIIYFTLFGFIKMFLLLVFVLLIAGNVISLCISFLMAFANAISMPVFVKSGVNASLTSFLLA